MRARGPRPAVGDERLDLGYRQRAGLGGGRYRTEVAALTVGRRPRGVPDDVDGHGVGIAAGGHGRGVAVGVLAAGERLGIVVAPHERRRRTLAGDVPAAVARVHDEALGDGAGSDREPGDGRRRLDRRPLPLGLVDPEERGQVDVGPPLGHPVGRRDARHRRGELLHDPFVQLGEEILRLGLGDERPALGEHGDPVVVGRPGTRPRAREAVLQVRHPADVAEPGPLDDVGRAVAPARCR